jgi:hypothetical protein
VTLDGVDMIGDEAHDRGGIARPGADVEHLVARSDRGGFDHKGYDVGLGDCLALVNRQWRVFIGELLETRRHEALAANGAHGVKDMPVGNAAARDLAVDHAVTLGSEIGGHGGLLSPLEQNISGGKSRLAPAVPDKRERIRWLKAGRIYHRNIGKRPQLVRHRRQPRLTETEVRP